MIPRYEKKEISQIWSDEFKFNTYLKVELAILKSLEGEYIPQGTAEKIEKNATIDPRRIDQLEAITRHDIIAFCTSITENIDPEIGKYFHYGVTSSDVIDTALTLQIKASIEQIFIQMKRALVSIKEIACKYKDTITMGRSHGMFAEPMSFGQKWLGFYNELSRRFREMTEFYQNDLRAQFSGAVGNFTILTPQAEKKACDILGLKVEPQSTQVLPRDRIAKLISIHALIAGLIERMCVEIRHLHRSEIGELNEGFKKGQKGSSTMPHKKNPISSENLTGMARLLRSHAQISLDNMVLWHERDISHSSAERIYLPDNFGILYYALERLANTLDQMVFHQEKIEKRVEENFSYLSSYYLHHLISKTDLKRDDLYEIVQNAAFKAQEEGKVKYFHSTIEKQLKSKKIKLNLPSINYQEVKNIFLKHVDDVFDRSFKEYPLPTD